VKKGGKKQTASAKKIEDGVQKHLIVPFVKGETKFCPPCV
jgi:hypothetical protein